MIKLQILFICIIIVLIIVYILKHSYESFANPVVVSNIFTNPDEIFLVAQGSPELFNINRPDTYNYNISGYTHSEAIRACQAVGPGVQLADLNKLSTSPSNLSLQVALDLSANWCAAGWTTNSTTIAYFPMSDFKSNKCELSAANTAFSLPTSKGIGTYTPPLDKKAFAICVGPKPPNPTAKVRPFNKNSYSMYNNEMMKYIKSGVSESDPYNNDIFPVQFTDAQVYVALKNTNYDIKLARESLKTKYQADSASTSSDTLNTELLSNFPLESTHKSDSTLWQANPINKSCLALSDVYIKMDTALSSLKTIFWDLSGSVENIIKAKDENGILQTTIAQSCLNLSASTSLKSSACSRLLSLDYDLLYRNKSSDGYTQSNTINDLESLNYALRLREVEIQQSLGSLQQVLLSLKSTTSTPNACDTTLASLLTKYKSNIVTTPTGTKPIDNTVYFDENGNYSSEKTLFSAPTTAFKIGREILYNPVDSLKIKLQEISPFFSGAQYSSLVSDVLNQLSVTLRTPDIDYTNTSAIAEATKKNLLTISSIFPNLT